MTHRADPSRFLDDRYSAPLCPNGMNPATLLEKAMVGRIIDCIYFKDACFGLNEADIVDRVVQHVSFIGGTYGSAQKPTPFLCLLFKLLQLAPGDDIVQEYMGHGGEKFKYLRVLAAFYVRLTRRSEDVYKTLEPMLEDRRKLRRKGAQGTTLTYVDQFVDDLLSKDRVCGTSLWQLTKRELLEDLEKLEPRVSPLGDIEDLLEEMDGESGEAQANGDATSDEGEVEEVDPPSRSRSRSRGSDDSRRRPYSRDRDERMDVDDDSDRYQRRSRSRSQGGRSDGRRDDSR
ncbi:putative PRP38 family-domain-containing protein [Seiridium unicorne]|uniref:Pre-mRNA-splicing factor 38 n=1 Tax=Seiridium unicorne TaxID=138068 RepID=A0ABR2UPW1_9PEZI